MAAPTTVETLYPSYALTITGTDIDAGNNDYPLSYNQQSLSRGFSIITGTLTAIDVTILAQNGALTKDITNDLTGATTLASDTPYVIDIPFPCERAIIRVARTAGTNAVNLEVFAPRR